MVEQVNNLARECFRRIGQRAQIAIHARQSFRSKSSGHAWDTGREGLQQLHAHARAAENRTEKNCVIAEGRAHIVYVADHLNIGKRGQGMRRRRVGSDDDEAHTGTLRDHQWVDMMHEPIERFAIWNVTEAAQEK